MAILDTGGQYCHLIARKVRDLGVYAEVLPSDEPASRLRSYRGIIISGGPASVYEADSPTIDPGILDDGPAVLGICYGLHLMAHLLGGEVRKGQKGEYGAAMLDLTTPGPLFRGAEAREQQIWMSHRDSVKHVPPRFRVTGTTSTCAVAVMVDEQRKQYGIQFHPEVVHTPNGRRILSNFVFDICGCAPDWNPKNRIPLVEDQIREIVRDRNVFFFVSGGVDSTVAYTLCLRALGKERVSGFYVDTGLMREGETAFVRSLFHSLGSEAFMVEEAGDQFLAALHGVLEPEKKRHIIGEQFVMVQERILQTGHFLDGNWILGQGTIYPDTIESGGSAKAEVIKTHHNRVAGIQRLIAQGRIIEPLSSFYKDEVRDIGRELGLPSAFLDRHPFPGPGLAIRCLCSGEAEAVRPDTDGVVVPVHTVGVQGDSRSYRPVLAIEGGNLHERATELINRRQDINRVISCVAAHSPVASMQVWPADLSAERMDRLRKCDAVVRAICERSGFDRNVWQFPVVLIPLGTDAARDSIVLRPIDSVDGMTAQSVAMDPILLAEFRDELMRVPGIAGVFYDLTHKPPGTIEWE